ncbi:MAG: Dipeptide transport system permease protein DppC, partial [uncultured Thermomicrobiales bacterium]
GPSPTERAPRRRTTPPSRPRPGDPRPSPSDTNPRLLPAFVAPLPAEQGCPRLPGGLRRHRRPRPRRRADLGPGYRLRLPGEPPRRQAQAPDDRRLPPRQRRQRPRHPDPPPLRRPRLAPGRLPLDRGHPYRRRRGRPRRRLLRAHDRCGPDAPRRRPPLGPQSAALDPDRHPLPARPGRPRADPGGRLLARYRPDRSRRGAVPPAARLRRCRPRRRCHPGSDHRPPRSPERDADHRRLRLPLDPRPDHCRELPLLPWRRRPGTDPVLGQHARRGDPFLPHQRQQHRDPRHRHLRHRPHPLPRRQRRPRRLRPPPRRL